MTQPGIAAADLALGLLAGLALAALHLAWLWRATRRLGQGAGLGALLGGAALRLAAVVAGFGLIAAVAPDPAPTLLAALLGFTLLRVVALRILRRAGAR